MGFRFGRMFCVGVVDGACYLVFGVSDDRLTEAVCHFAWLQWVCTISCGDRTGCGDGGCRCSFVSFRGRVSFRVPDYLSRLLWNYIGLWCGFCVLWSYRGDLSVDSVF